MGGMGGMANLFAGMGGKAAGGGSGDGMGGLFNEEAEAKLKANPRIAKYFEDPQFKNTFALCKIQPQMLMQVMQSDPRFMDVFKELTGVDLMAMGEQKAKNEEQRAEEDKVRKAAAEK